MSELIHCFLLYLVFFLVLLLCSVSSSLSSFLSSSSSFLSSSSSSLSSSSHLLVFLFVFLTLLVVLLFLLLVHDFNNVLLFVLLLILVLVLLVFLLVLLSRWTQQVILSVGDVNDFKYQPGDHVAIVPANQSDIVNSIIKRLDNCPDPDQPIQILVQKEVHSPNGIIKTWEPHRRLPQGSVRELLTRFLDVTTPPTPNFLHLLAQFAGDNGHRTRLDQLASDSQEYEDWKHWHYPHLKEVLEEFHSVNIDAGILLTQLPLMQSRFYSISSSPKAHPGEIHVTVAVVEYRTEGGKGPIHYGVCSTFLKNIKPGQMVECFVRSATSFHMPKDHERPVILVGPGTGIAPFRSFWHHRAYIAQQGGVKVGKMTLFFGCRTRSLDLYAEEKEEMRRMGVLNPAPLALSREHHIPKKYVQDVIVEMGREVYRQIVEEKGHFYVCGDCTMAECVYQKLKAIVQEHGKFTDQEVETFVLQLRDENRYHEDIFGITLRTEEIHRQTRETVKNRLSLQTQQSTGDSAPTQDKIPVGVGQP